MHATPEDLRFLADQPLGNRALEEEAQRKVGTEERRSDELKQLCKRVSKRFLPLGKKRVTRAESIAATQSFKEQQIDIEDAIEQAGGKRGGTKAA